MRALVIFFIFTFYYLNANAQIGDLFRKLGDVIDGVTTKLTEDNNKIQTKEEENLTNQNSEKISKEFIINGQNVFISDYPNLVGIWSSPEYCKLILDKRADAYGAQINLRKNELTIKTFENLTEFIDESLVTNIQKISIDGRIYLKLTGNYTNSNLKNASETRIWDITNISNNQFFLIDRVYSNQQIIKNGIDIKTGRKIGFVEKCQLKNDIQVSEVNNSNKIKNTFGIKNFYLGESPPYGGKCQKSEFFEETKIQTCEYSTTILEVPYKVTLVIYDGKITSVLLFDNLFAVESGNSYNKNIWQQNNTIGKLTSINNFPKYLDDLISSVNAKNNEIKPIITKNIADSMKSLNHIFLTATKAEIELNRSGQNYSKNLQNFMGKLMDQCKNCKSTIYAIEWKLPSYYVGIDAFVPESKEHPYPFYNVTIVYKDNEFEERMANAKKLITQLDDKKRQDQINQEKIIEDLKNEKRKKDF